MKLVKLKMFAVTAAAAAALAAAPSALACDRCLSNDNQGGQICWSGFTSGVGSCYLNDDKICVVDGSCSEPSNNDTQTWNDYYSWDGGGWWNWS